MLLNNPINVNNLPADEGGNFEPLPAGWYTTTIADAELKDTKAGTGQYIKIRYDVTGPTHEGRVVFGNLNIRNANPKAEEIGQKQLGQLMTAIGLTELSDTDQLIGAPVSVKLAIRKSEEYGDSNDVKAWKAAGNAAPKPAPAQTQTPAPAASGGAPPWAAK